MTITELAVPATAMGCPYVGLRVFTEDDAAMFFGREPERAVLISNLRAARLTLLYAQSGTGKSSLLRAGVASRLTELAQRSFDERGTARNIPVAFSSWRDEPTDELIAEIGQQITRFRPTASQAWQAPQRLGEALEQASKATNATLLVILDQFEEYFLYRSEEARDGRFADELASCINSGALRANFLISIREDAYSGLGDLLKSRIDNVYGNYLRLTNLDADSAREAIEKPLASFNEAHREERPVEIEPALVDAVLGQLRPDQFVLDQTGKGRLEEPNGDEPNGDEIAAPYLQLVMERLWQAEVGLGSRKLRLVTLEQLGGAQTIVRTHVDRALSGLPPDDREAAVDILYHLVTPSGTKIALTAADLAEYTNRPVGPATALLERLASTETRLLRPVPPPPGKEGGIRYEISHDLLAPAILDWGGRQKADRLEQEKEVAEQQARIEKRRARNFRALAFGSLAVLVVAILLAVVAFVSGREAQAARREAEALGVAASAEAILGQNPQRATAYALRALRMDPILEAQSALRDALPALQTVRTLRDGTVVFSAVFDPADPNKVASADRNGTAWIWDVATGRRLIRLSPPGNPVQAGTADTVAFDPAGTKVAVGYGSGTVVLFDARSGNELQRIKAGPTVHGVQFVGSTGELAIATQRGVGLWLPRYGSKCCDLLSRNEQANSIAVNPANPLEFAVATYNGTILWTLGSDLRPLQHRWLDRQKDNDAEFSPDGREVVTASRDGRVRVYDLATGQQTLVLAASEANATSAAFSPDQTRIVTAYSSGTTRVWDASTGLQLTLLAGNDAYVGSARFSPDGSEVVTAGDDGTIRVWQAQPREMRMAFPTSFKSSPNVPEPVYSAEYSPTGDRILAVDGSGAAYVFTGSGEPAYSSNRLFNGLFNGLPVSIPGGTAQVNSARFNRAGNEIVTADSDGTVRLWHASGGNYTQIRQIRPKGMAADYAAFSPDGSRVVIVTGNDTAEVRSAQTGQLLRTLNPGHGFSLSVAAFSPSGRQILTGDGNGQVEVWDAATWHEKVLGKPGPGVSDVEFSKSGSEFVTASDNGAVTIWAARDDRPLRRPISACATPSTASFSPDGSKIVIACGNGSVPVFDAVTGQQLTVLPAAGAGTVNAAAFSPDGQSIVTAIGGEGPDDVTGQVRIWNAELATASLSALERDAARGALKPSPVPPASREPTILTGTWTGSYICLQGRTGLSLVMHAVPSGILTATFSFYAIPPNLGVPSGSFTMTGTYSAAGIRLNRSRWITQPPGYIMGDLKAGLPTNGGTVLRGTISTPPRTGCSTFDVTKSPSSGSG
jgi:WD40 repeat protein